MLLCCSVFRFLGLLRLDALRFHLVPLEATIQWGRHVARRSVVIAVPLSPGIPSAASGWCSLALAGGRSARANWAPRSVGRGRESSPCGRVGAGFTARAQPVRALRTQSLELVWAWVEGLSLERCIGEVLLTERRLESEESAGQRGRRGWGSRWLGAGRRWESGLAWAQAGGGQRGGSRVWGLSVESCLG